MDNIGRNRIRELLDGAAASDRLGHVRADVGPQELAVLCELGLACAELLDAPHPDHFASRLDDDEMDAVNKMKRLLKDDGR